jgi:hypothetical protein
LIHGLKKDFFSKNTSFNLLKKLSKISETAKKIVDICDDLEKNGFTINSNYAYTFTSVRHREDNNSYESIISK